MIPNILQRILTKIVEGLVYARQGLDARAVSGYCIGRPTEGGWEAPSMPLSLFLATLGSEPQVVTLALQLLAQKGVEIAEARVIHTAPRSPAIAR